MAGLFFATVTWHNMHLLVFGNVINLPGPGFVWQSLQSKPRDRCFLWLYGMGWTGGVCSDGLSGTICFAACGDAAASAVRPAANSRTAASAAAITASAIHVIFFITGWPRKSESAVLLRSNYAFLPTTSSMLVPKS